MIYWFVMRGIVMQRKSEEKSREVNKLDKPNKPPCSWCGSSEYKRLTFGDLVAWECKGCKCIFIFQKGEGL